jgi:hypothetical protein
MKSTNCCLAMMLIFCAEATPGLAAAPATPVLAQDLQNLRIPGKVSSVTWTRRDESCTLQVVLQMPTEYQSATKDAVQRAAQGLAPAPPPTPRLPQLQAWLLRADGTLIGRNPGSGAFPPAIKTNDGIPLEVRYSYPPSAAQDAVAVAIMVDGVYYIEQLKPFGKDSN